MIKTPLSTVIGGVGMYTKNTLIIGGKIEPPFDPASLFENGEQGFYIDPHALDSSLISQTVPMVPDLSSNNNHASNTNSAQQALLSVNASTGYKYLSFDGTDDCYATAAIDFSHTDKVTMIAALRKLSDTASSVVVELTSSPTKTGSFTLLAPAANGATSYSIAANKQTLTQTTGGQFAPAPDSSVIRAHASEKISMYRNGKLINELSIAGLENFKNDTLYIGRRGGLSNPFSGHIYALLIIDRILTDAEIQKVEKEFAKRIGVTL